MLFASDTCVVNSVAFDDSDYSAMNEAKPGFELCKSLAENSAIMIYFIFFILFNIYPGASN